MKLIQTRRDLSVWILASYMLLVNIICIWQFGRQDGIIIGNPIGLASVAAFVFYSRHNKNLNSWLNKKL